MSPRHENSRFLARIDTISPQSVEVRKFSEDVSWLGKERGYPPVRASFGLIKQIHLPSVGV